MNLEPFEIPTEEELEFEVSKTSRRIDDEKVQSPKVMQFLYVGRRSSCKIAVE